MDTDRTDTHETDDATREDEPPGDGSRRPDANASPADGGANSGTPRECHRRGCTKRASFVVRERYLEETGKGAVVAKAALCRDHTAEERPTNLENSYPDYLFRVDPLPGANGVDDAS